MVNYTVSRCDLVEIIMETIRYLSQIALLHVLNYMSNDKEPLFDTNFFKIMLFTALAIVLYHIFIKKMFKSKFKKMKYVCDDDD